MNIVVLDSEHLAGEIDFPPLEAAKYGWKQYPSTPQDLIGERSWRSHIVMSVATPLNRKVLGEMNNLALLIVVGDTRGEIDEAALQERPVTVLHLTGYDPADPQQAQALCDLAVKEMDRFIAGNQ